MGMSWELYDCVVSLGLVLVILLYFDDVIFLCGVLLVVYYGSCIVMVFGGVLLMFVLMVWDCDVGFVDFNEVVVVCW